MSLFDALPGDDEEDEQPQRKGDRADRKGGASDGTKEATVAAPVTIPKLPDPGAMHACMFLPASSIVRVALTCRHLRALVSRRDLGIWRNLLQLEFPEANRGILQQLAYLALQAYSRVLKQKADVGRKERVIMWKTFYLVGHFVAQPIVNHRLKNNAGRVQRFESESPHSGEMGQAARCERGCLFAAVLGAHVVFCVCRRASRSGPRIRRKTLAEK